MPVAQLDASLIAEAGELGDNSVGSVVPRQAMARPLIAITATVNRRAGEGVMIS